MKYDNRITVGSGAVAIGPNAQAVGQGGRVINVQTMVSGDQLATEFAKLRESLLKQATLPEHYAAIGQISSAEIAAKASDGSGVARALSALGAAGKWTYEISKNIAANLAADLIRRQIGF